MSVTHKTSDQCLPTTHLLRRLLIICLTYSTGAFVATFFLVTFGLETGAHNIPESYKVLVVIVIAPLLYAVDFLFVWLQFRPLASYLNAQNEGFDLSTLREKALVRALNFPTLTVLRVMGIHGPVSLASLTGMNLLVGNRYFGTTFSNEDIAVQWCMLFVLVPAHAFLEYFAVLRLFRKVIPSIAEGHPLPLAVLSRKIIFVGIRTKLLLLSIFITVVPQAVLGFTVVLKLSSAERQFGTEILATHLPGLVDWIKALILFSTIVTVTIAILLTNDFARSIRMLTSALRCIEKNQLENRLTIVSTDEFAALNDGYNEMADGLFERNRFVDAFGKLVSPALADHVIKHGMELGGISVHATVLFSDIRGFTSLSEKLKAQEVVELLNRYFTVMVRVLHEHGGWVNKFGGDSILAVFGVPTPLSDHSQRAVAAALDMRVGLAEFNAEQQSRGGPPLKIGIGLHSGWLVAGNMGSPERMEFTVIGDAVNVASRLQSLTKSLGTDILISAEIYQSIGKDVETREMPAAEVQGKEYPIKIYSLD